MPALEASLLRSTRHLVDLLAPFKGAPKAALLQSIRSLQWLILDERLSDFEDSRGVTKTADVIRLHGARHAKETEILTTITRWMELASERQRLELARADKLVRLIDRVKARLPKGVIDPTKYAAGDQDVFRKMQSDLEEAEARGAH